MSWPIAMLTLFHKKMHTINPVITDNSPNLCKYFGKKFPDQMYWKWAATLLFSPSEPQWVSEWVRGCGGEVSQQHQILRIHTSATVPVRQSAASAGVPFQTYCCLSRKLVVLSSTNTQTLPPVLSTGNSFVCSPTIPLPWRDSLLELPWLPLSHKLD